MYDIDKSIPKKRVFHIKEGLDIEVEFCAYFCPIIICPACGQTHKPVSTYGGWYCETTHAHIRIPDFEKLKREVLPELVEYEVNYDE